MIELGELRDEDDQAFFEATLFDLQDFLERSRIKRVGTIAVDPLRRGGYDFSFFEGGKPGRKFA